MVHSAEYGCRGVGALDLHQEQSPFPRVGKRKMLFAKELVAWARKKVFLSDELFTVDSTIIETFERV